MGPELLTPESLLGGYQELLSWLGILMTWMSGLLVALSALGAILYVGLLWEHREAGRDASPRLDRRRAGGRSEKKKRAKSYKLTRKGSGWSPTSTVSEWPGRLENAVSAETATKALSSR